MDITLRSYCKLYTIVFLVLIVEATSNNSNDTSHEHRQSRVSGRIVKVYSGTRPEPILCAGEGFQADPHNCAVFYRCMRSGSGKYTVFRFQCGPGTVYDPDTEVCNHPRSTKRSECGGYSPPPAVVDRIDNNEIEGIQSEIPSPITNKPLHIESTAGVQATFTTVNPWGGSSSSVHTTTKRQTSESSPLFITSYPWGSTIGHINTDLPFNPFNLPQNTVIQNYQVPVTTFQAITSAIPHSNARDNICSSDGFMADSENCRKFYRCVGNQRGTFTRFEFSCSESTIWDDDTQSCNHVWAVKRSRCGRSSQDQQFTTNTEAYQTDGNSDKTIQQQLQVSYGSKVTQTQTQISDGSVIQNQTQINYGDRLNQNKDTQAKQNQTQISHGSAVSQSQTQIDYSDKGVQTQLQIDHSQQASQTQVQIHESTSSTPTTSTDSTSHADTSEGNICGRSGFMGDENDCKIFYRCVDNGRGGYTRYQFSCGEGTVWDQSIEACNHVWAVKECGGIVPAETTSAPQSAVSASKSTQNYYTTLSTESYHTSSELIATDDNEDIGYGQENQHPPTLSSTTSSSTSTSSTTVKTPSIGNCESSGFFGDDNDCKIFYRCVENGKGSFTKYEFKCGEGTVWDPDIEACNHAWAVKRCGGNISPDINTEQTTTQKQNTLSTAQTQNTIVPQSPTESAATQNDDYDSGYGSGNNDFTITTTTKQPQNEGPSIGSVCQNSGFMGDENDCKKFYRCVDNGNGRYTRYEFTCGEGTVWDAKIDACNHAWAVEKCGGTADHHEATTQAKPTTIYEVGESSSTEADLNSGSSTFSPSTASSVSTVTQVVSIGSNDCTNSGFMGDRTDCKKFYRCVDNGRGSYTKYEFSCGEGTVWDQEIEACNHAWAVTKCGGTASSSTNPETTTQIRPIMNDEIDNGYPSNINSDPEITTQSTTTYSTTQSSKVPSQGNNCISSGFIGDKNDCKKFYRCVDDGQGGYTRYEFSCGEGTLWDQSIEACNHAWAVKDCGTAGIKPVQPSSESPTQGTLTSETDDLGYPQNTDKTTTSAEGSENEYQTQKPISSSGVCTSEGFYGDRNDCKKFYRCVDNGKGSYTKYDFTCGEGTIWVQDILACDHDTGDTNCSYQTTSKPLTTEGLHQAIEDNQADSSSSEPQTIDKQEDEYNNDGVSNKPSKPGNADCSSEGFYGNENDCRQFYRCVDNGQGGYTKYDFTCGEGTAWDSDIQTCNHIDQVKRCQGASGPHESVMHDEDNNQPTESSSTSASSGTTSSGTSSSSTTASSATSSESNNEMTSGNNDRCHSEGYFGNTQDCKKFYRCVDNGKGGYTKYDFDCGEGTIWDQDITTCNHPQDVVNPSCNQSQDGSTPSTASTSSSSSDTSSSTDSLSSSDSSSTTSLSAQSTTESSQSSSNCSQEESSKKPVNQNITCDKAGYYPNPNDCKKFYRCVDWDGDGKRFSVYHFECGEGTIWDPAVETCNHEESVYPPRDCSGSQSQSENQSPSTEGPTTAQQETTSNSTQTTSTSQSGTEQTTQSTTTEQTTTQQSTTSEQTPQQTSSSEQTTTQQTSSSEQTTTQQSTTSEQTTTQQSTTSEQTTTQQSTTSEQTTTQQSTTSEQTTTQQSTTSEQTTTQQSTTSEQTTQQTSSPEQTTTQQSTTSEQTTTQQSTTSEQTTGQSTTSEQTTQESTTSEQTTQESTTTEQSTTSEQTTTEQSTTSESTTEQSSSTTESSTTEQSTTQQSTTTQQIDQSTTEGSTSSEGTTTEQSTTEQSTESSTTEGGTDENTSESKCPETSEDQSLFVCPTSFKRHPKYCNLFYQCDEDDDTHDVKIAVFTCPNNTIYDETQTRCVEESKADKKCNGKIAQKRRFKRLDKDYKEPLVVAKESLACTNSGYYSFEKDSECSPAFLKCKTDNKTNKLRGLVYKCPAGYVYWSISKRCEPKDRVKDCKRSQNNWTGRWEIPVERRNVAPSQ